MLILIISISLTGSNKHRRDDIKYPGHLADRCFRSGFQEVKLI